jgi:streptogramin lyase
VVRISTDGNTTELALPSRGSNPDGIAAGPAKSIWVTETGSDSIVKINLP